jgi:dTDP-4-amino-4,6-dideoxygalactose transaminase
VSLNSFDAVRQLEAAVAEYCGSEYACATTSCTMAIQVACMVTRVGVCEIPRRTFVGVPQAIISAGGRLKFSDEEWSGGYQIKPYPIWDMARRMRRSMYTGGLMCISFHASKICGHTDGGAILYDNEFLHGLLQQMCYDGRPVSGLPNVGECIRGVHGYMALSTASGILRKLETLPDHNDDLPNSEYPDLSLLSAFSPYVV